MAYNNGFPMNYGYQMPQPIPQQPMPQMPIQQSNQKVWVQGEAGAKSYLVAPNTTVDLWDSEQQTIYVKSADNTGMPVMKILDYTIRNSNNASTTPLSESKTEYVTKDELNAFKGEITKEFKALREEMGA